jgi:hypothetical protein
MVLVTFYDFLKLEPGMPIDVVKPWKMYSAYFTGMVYSYGILTTRAVKDEWGKAITVPVGHEHKWEPNHLCGILEDEELGLVMSKGAYTLRSVTLYLDAGKNELEVERNNLRYMHFGHKRF